MVTQGSASPDVGLAPGHVGIRATRLLPLDALRGVIMIVMALDHANLFIAHQHPRPEIWMGPLPTFTSGLAFLTRFVTHLAAPGFFFLMGVSVILFADSRHKLSWTRGAIVGHLIARGLLLVLLQFWIENPAWGLDIVYVGVLYGLGTAMIVGALLLPLGTGWLVGIGLAAILVTQVLIPGLVQQYVSFSLPVRLLIVPGQTGNVLVYYPTIPWLGTMIFGLVFGRWLLEKRDRTYRRAFIIGLVFLVLFIVVRAAGGFGNILPAPGPGWIAFLNVVKYPPSLVFILMTLGTDLVLLAALARVCDVAERWGRPLAVYGSSPLFFYIAHLYLFSLIGKAISPSGIGLIRMYPVWLAGLVILYPLCWAYGKFKRRQAPNSLWRFL